MNLFQFTMMSVSAKVSLCLVALVLSGCASFGSDSASAEAQAEQTEVNAEQQLTQLQTQIQAMQSDWDKQKPALERLVTNEEDLQFLIKTLSDMSKIEDAPSRSAYLGKTEMTNDQREALYSISSLIKNQQQLLDMVQSLTEILKNNKGAFSEPNQIVASYETAEPVAQPQMSGSVQAEFSTVSSASVSSAAGCQCDSSDQQDNSGSQSTNSRNTEWFGLTQPYQEAAPAMGVAQSSQLDSAAVNNGQPIPGLAVKTFSRKTLPSELSAAGADLQAYSAAPLFQQSRKSLSDYVAQLAFKLAGNQQLQGAKVGVASFVFFDAQLEQTSAVGNQLAEELSTVLPGYGASVIEYKLTKHITVSPTGDLSLSRRTSKLRSPQGMDYVLTGTMVPTRRGLQINSRVVSTQTNVVISSATTLIPALVLQQL